MYCSCVWIIHCLTFSRRKAYQTHDGNSFVSCLGKRKQKKKIIYSSHHSGEFEAYDIVLYEPVVLKENFQYGTLVLIGTWRKYCQFLKKFLLSVFGSVYDNTYMWCYSN